MTSDTKSPNTESSAPAGQRSSPSAGSVPCVVKITGPSLNIEMRIDSHRANLLMRAALDAAMAEANINYREQTPTVRPTTATKP